LLPEPAKSPEANEEGEEPREISLVRALVMEFIKDLGPLELRQLAGDLIQTPERIEMQQQAVNQQEIQELRNDLATVKGEVRQMTGWIKKYGTLAIGALIGSDVVFKMIELFF
jgi:hypothetical protein